MVKIADHSAVIFGTHFPNRIFVGCLPSKATAQDLAEFFSHFGAVNEAKVVLDENGGSKRFGFVSFGNEEDVNTVLKHGSIFFWGKKINVGPAVKKRFHDDVKGKPATLVYDEATYNAGTKSRVVYQTIENCQLPTVQNAPRFPMIEFCPSYMHHGAAYQPYFSQDWTTMYQVPHYASHPATSSLVPPLIHSQPYQMTSQTVSQPAPIWSYATPMNANSTCGALPGSTSIQQHFPNFMTSCHKMDSSKVNDMATHHTDLKITKKAHISSEKQIEKRS